MSMKHELRMAAALIGGLSFLSMQPALSVTTGLDFAGGCPEGATTVLCDMGANADAANVAALLGVDVSLVTYVGEDTGSGGPGFSATGIGGDVSGSWSVTDSSITHLAFKSNGYFILGALTAASGDWMNDTSAAGSWDISLVGCPASICGSGRPYVDADFLNADGDVAKLSNVRAFSVVPIPAAVWLFVSALGLLSLTRWRRKGAQAV